MKTKAGWNREVKIAPPIHSGSIMSPLAVKTCSLYKVPYATILTIELKFGFAEKSENVMFELEKTTLKVHNKNVNGIS